MDYKNILIRDLDISVRVRNALYKSFAHIETVQDLYEYNNERSIENVKGIGKTALKELNEALMAKGLPELKEEQKWQK